ncbi:hypothetical protein KFE25_012788 [Diacronema lutheri]|uniref:Uncharacterized protein n=1 Tax=Diacronema lutheri TaxID=2081491 RepID=A0A8J5X4W4_DIALT|nr:hypothetical protein KFE25_012788 [Diacronema lutheri]
MEDKLEDKLGLSLDDLIKTSKREKVAARKPAGDKAAQVKARSQALRAEKVGRARGMDVDAGAARGAGGGAGAKKKVIVKPTTKAVRPMKVGIGRARPTQAATKASRGTVGTPKGGRGAPGKGAKGGAPAPTGLIVKVRVDSPARSPPAAVGRGRAPAGRGGRGGRSPALVQPMPGRRPPAPAGKGRGGGSSGGGGAAKRSGRGIVKPVPRAPVSAFGSKTANAAAQASARRGKGARAASVGKARGRK